MPNRFARALLAEFERLLGTNGLVAVLNQAGLAGWRESPPADDLQREVRFSDMAALYRSLEGLYGLKGARGLIRQANREAFNQLWTTSAEFGDRFGASSPSMEANAGANLSWEALTLLFSEISDLQFEVLSREEGVQLTLTHCPDCLNHHSEHACCAGMLGWLEGASTLFHRGRAASVHEQACQASGAAACTFIISPLDEG